MSVFDVMYDYETGAALVSCDTPDLAEGAAGVLRTCVDVLRRCGVPDDKIIGLMSGAGPRMLVCDPSLIQPEDIIGPGHRGS